MDDSLLSALAVPLVLGACLALFVVIGTSISAGQSSELDQAKRVWRRRRHRRGKGTFAGGYSKLPVEVIEHIIDFLKDDVSSLKAATRIHRRWLPRARYHLYRKIVVKKGGPDPYTLRFYPGAVRCVREVWIRGDLCDEVSRSVLMNHPHVESLHIDVGEDGLKHLEISQHHFPYFPALKKLSLSRVALRSGAELFSVLASLCQLRELTVDLTSISYLDPSRAQYSVTQPDSLTTVETIHMAVRPNLNLGVVPHALLVRVGGALTALSISIRGLSTDFLSAFQLLKDLDLSPSPSLESLRVIFYWAEHPWFNSDPRTEQAKQLATAVLASIPGCALRRIRFDVVVPLTGEVPRWLRFFNLKFLDAFAEPSRNTFLSSQAMERAIGHAKRLECFELRLSFTTRLGPTDFAAIEKQVCEQLPLLKEKGILRCRCSLQ